MIGHKLERTVHNSTARIGETAGLSVESICGGTITDLDLIVQPGEIVGVAGITGSGRELVAPFITGQTPSDSGNVVVCGTPIPNYDPHAAIDAGLAFVPADRASLGIIPLESVTNNLTLADIGRNWSGGRLRHGEERAETRDWIDRLQIKTAGTEIPIGALSGGNQQKVLFGRTLRLAPKVLVLDEPTSGIDVKAKDQILQLIDEAAGGGAAVLVVSTDTDELVQVAHRIVIMVGGTIVAELGGDEMTTEHVERAQLQSTKATTS